MGHVFWPNEGVEFIGGDETELQRGFTEADSRVVRGFGNLGGLVVSDLGRKSSDEHQGIVKVAVNLFAVDLNSHDAMIHKAI